MIQHITPAQLHTVIETGEVPPSLPESQLLALSDPEADTFAIAGVRSAILYAANQLQHSRLPVRVGGEGERLSHQHDMSLVARAILTETSHNLRLNEAMRVELGLPDRV